jgi:hypothetical protein
LRRDADQAGSHGIGQDVSGLVHDGFGVREGHCIEAPGRPEGLTPAERRVDGASDEGVEKLKEGRKVRVRVGDDEVVVVGEDAIGVDKDAEAAGSDGEHVQEDLVGAFRGAQEVPALEASAGDEVRDTREDLPWGRHATGPSHESGQEARQ